MSYYSKKEEWNTGDDSNVVKSCDFCTDSRVTIIISDEVLSVVNELCKRVEDEWQLLLCGTDDGKELVVVDDYFVPIQEISKASVKNLDCIDKQRIEELRIVATIHSHSTFGVFFSQQDYDKTNTSLIRNHIVVNNAGDMKATKRIDLPCGKAKFLDAVVTRAMPELPAVEDIKGYDNISRVTYTYPTYTPLNIGGMYTEAIKGKRKKHAFNME